MPYSKISFKETADLLQISERDLQKLVTKKAIPFINERGKIVFRKNDIKDWAIQITFSNDKKKKSVHTILDNLTESTRPRMITDILSPYYAHSLNIQARTKYSTLKELVNQASITTYVTDPDKLLKMLKEREEIQPTGFNNGIAIPHPKIHHSEFITESFLLVGIVPGGVPFGALDGELSDLFFLCLSATDEDHLFMISRLGRLLKKTSLADDLRNISCESEISDCFRQNEMKIISCI